MHDPEKHAERENIGRYSSIALRISTYLIDFMKLGSHPPLCSLLFKNFRVHLFYHAKVTNLKLTLGVDEDVLELDIEVGHAGLRVEGTNALAHLHEKELEKLLVFDRSILYNVVKQVSMLTFIQDHGRLTIFSLIALAPLSPAVVFVPWNVTRNLNSRSLDRVAVHFEDMRMVFKLFMNRRFLLDIVIYTVEKHFQCKSSFW